MQELIYTAGDLEDALFAQDIDRLAAAFALTTEEALRLCASERLTIAQPTTISPARRAAGVQLSLFDAEQDVPALPGWEQYRRGKTILAQARIATLASMRSTWTEIHSPRLKRDGKVIALVKIA